MFNSSLITTTASMAIAITALTARSGPSDEGVTPEPGFANCRFNHELAGHEWDGSGSYSDGTLETAAVRETDEAYEGILTLYIPAR